MRLKCSDIGASTCFLTDLSCSSYLFRSTLYTPSPSLLSVENPTSGLIIFLSLISFPSPNGPMSSILVLFCCYRPLSSSSDWLRSNPRLSLGLCSCCLRPCMPSPIPFSASFSCRLRHHLRRLRPHSLWCYPLPPLYVVSDTVFIVSDLSRRLWCRHFSSVPDHCCNLPRPRHIRFPSSALESPLSVKQIWVRFGFSIVALSSSSSMSPSLSRVRVLTSSCHLRL